MKPLAVAISIATLALSVNAADKNEQPKQNTTTTVLAAPAAPQAQDSRLVRAAKATGRLGKKPTMVITNETLLRTGGHFTTTTLNTQLPPPLAPASGDAAKVIAAERANREAAEKAKKDAAAKKERAMRNAAADYYGESIEERVEDPAMQEHRMQQVTSTQAQPPKPAKPPQN